VHKSCVDHDKKSNCQGTDFIDGVGGKSEKSYNNVLIMM